VNIERVTETDLDELLPLMRGYCDFYEVDPPDEALLTLSRSLLADPEREGIQLIARDDAGSPIGFATVYWTWQTLNASRLAVMNDLFVASEARGTGAADALIEACADEARGHGATTLAWQTAKDNARAQKVYDRVGAERSEWVDYALAIE
jgi:GNAT superfamily N-acetyltransferase